MSYYHYNQILHKFNHKTKILSTKWLTKLFKGVNLCSVHKVVKSIGGDKVTELTLRELLLRKFGSITKFADAIKWSNRKAYAIVNNKQEPTASDMEAIANIVEMQNPDEFVHFFYSDSPQCGQWAKRPDNKQ